MFWEVYTFIGVAMWLTGTYIIWDHIVDDYRSSTLGAFSFRMVWFALMIWLWPFFIAYCMAKIMKDG